MMGLANKYIRAIYATARQQGVSNEELHEAIEAGFGKTSVKQLKTAEVYRLLDGLKGKRRTDAAGVSGHKHTSRGYAMAMHGKRGVDTSGDAEFMVSESELDLLAQAAELRGWSADTLRQFIRRQIGAETVRTVKQFNRVFWPLKSMNRRDGLCTY